MVDYILSKFNLTHNQMSLQDHYKKLGIVHFEGHCQGVPKQVELIKRLASQPNIVNVLEIGFNGGHSAEVFLSTNPNIKLISVDIGIHKYVQEGKKFIDSKYPKRHTLIIGDSRNAVPSYTAIANNMKFDLIFIDGGHQYEIAKEDIINCHKLAHKDTIVLMDDFVANTSWIANWNVGVDKAWNEAIADGIVVQTEQHDYSRGRGDAIGKYIV
jgi:predicted O-methyltransferase YrrM